MKAKLKTKFVQFAMVIGALFIVGAAQANADSVLTFEGLQNLEPVLNYYNGGLGGMGSGPGPNFGVVFSANSLAGIEDEAGGTGQFAGEPSASTVVAFLSGGADTMNVAAGFTTGFSFFYSADNAPGSITVWDGLNGTGNKLATLSLPTNPNPNCAIDPGSTFCNWTPIGVSFSGTARSVDFGGTADQIGFDNITLGSSTPEQVPEPSSLVLLGLTAAGILGAMKKKFLVAI